MYRLISKSCEDTAEGFQALPSEHRAAYEFWEETDDLGGLFNSGQYSTNQSESRIE